MSYFAEDTSSPSANTAVLVPYPGFEWEAGGGGVGGSRHVGALQDALWPSTLREKETQPGVLAGVELLPTGLEPRLIDTLGRLYIVTDGVTHCADGTTAARLAAQIIGQHYYRAHGQVRPDPELWKRRLNDAFEQAHERLQAWRRRWYCAYYFKHRDGLPQYWNPEQVVWHNGQPCCSMCGERLRGLLTTAIALVVGEIAGQSVALVGGVGDSQAFRLPPGPGQTAYPFYSPRSKEFLGSSGRLDFTAQAMPFHPGEWILLGSDGFFSAISGQQGSAWPSALRERLTAAELHGAVPELVRQLGQWGAERNNPAWHDDQTLIAVSARATFDAPRPGRPDDWAADRRSVATKALQPRPDPPVIYSSPPSSYLKVDVPDTDGLANVGDTRALGPAAAINDVTPYSRLDGDDSPRKKPKRKRPRQRAMSVSRILRRTGIWLHRLPARWLAIIALFLLLGASFFWLREEFSQAGWAALAERPLTTAAVLSNPPLPTTAAMAALPTTATAAVPTSTALSPPTAASTTVLSAATPTSAVIFAAPPTAVSTPRSTATIGLSTSTPAPSGDSLPPLPLLYGPNVMLDLPPGSTYSAALQEALGFSPETVGAEVEAATNAFNLNAARQAEGSPGFLPPQPYQYLLVGQLEKFATSPPPAELLLRPRYDTAIQLRLSLRNANDQELFNLATWADKQELVWLLATSTILDTAVHDCRRNRASGDCSLSQLLGQSLSEELSVLEVWMVMGIDGSTLVPLDTPPSAGEPGWIFADIGPKGLVLALDNAQRAAVGERPRQYGLVEAQWIVDNNDWRLNLVGEAIFVRPDVVTDESYRRASLILDTGGNQ